MAKADDFADQGINIERALDNGGTNTVYLFGDYALDVDRGALTQAARDLQLRPKAYAVLLYLVENHGRLVSRTELLDSVWGDAAVSDDAVTQCLIEIRKALGDADQSKIRTVHRRGYVFELPVKTVSGSSGDSIVPAGSRDLALPLAMLAIVGVVFLGFLIWQYAGDLNDAAPGLVDIAQTSDSPSIAVLPFTDMSPKQDQEYFADGVSDEVLSLLTNVRGLRVTARTSSFSFKGQNKTIAEIAANLGVSYVLQGSVRRSGNSVRVSTQLIDARSSEQIWSESFDRTIDDVFEIQDEISAAVVDRLEVSLSEHRSPARRVSPESYSSYLKAMHLQEQVTESADSKVEPLLVEAVTLDPGNAPAWRELARLRWRHIGSRPMVRDDIQAVRTALNRSIAIDPDDPATIAYLAASIGDFDGDIQRAARLYERAIALNPANEHVLRTGLIFLTNYGEAEDAIALGEYGILRNPACLLCAHNLFIAYLVGGHYEKAESYARSIVSLHDRGHWMVGEALLLLGRPQDALDWYTREPHPGFRDIGMAMALHDLSRFEESEKLVTTFEDSWQFGVPYRVHVMAYAWTDRLDTAFEAIERIIDFDQKYGGEEIVRMKAWETARMGSSPFLAALHDDPRWQPLASRLAVTDGQRTALDFDLDIPAH